MLIRQDQSINELFVSHIPAGDAARFGFSHSLGHIDQVDRLSNVAQYTS
jgi:hypothetical protein